jgi:HAD superfamily hydrolase (TIGR01509 family)
VSRRRFAAVVFDLDGVLVDSEIWWDEVRADYAGDHDRTWTADDRAAVMGANSREWARIMRDRLDLATPADEIEAAIVGEMVDRYRVRGAPLLPGAEDAVRRLGLSVPLGLASSSHRSVIAAALESSGFSERFTAVVSSDEVESGKPAPDVYLEAARRLDIPAARCLAVEDSLNGVRAARAAGMTVVLIPNASVPPASGARKEATLVVASLDRIDLDALVAP